ncbi:MAG: Tm-1-like ATP-binding domain-containing protein, partial [Paracoccaceae bacterium]
LSGGEQQMLAISRALLLNPKLLVMDEPTEGLAPVIVDQVAEMLIRLGHEGGMDVLVIEQNIGVACAVADQVAIMVNGRINRVMESALLAADRDLQQALLGVGRHAHDETPEPSGDARRRESAAAPGPVRIYLSNPTPPTRWSQPAPIRVIEGAARTVTDPRLGAGAAVRPMRAAGATGGAVIVAGAFDTKAAELGFIAATLRDAGVRVRIVDLSTSGKPSGAETPPHAVAAYHPRGSSGVFTGERGTAVAGMALAFERWMRAQDLVAGAIGAGGSGAAALVAPAFRTLPVGVPKVIVSTIASGNVAQYVGGSDIMMTPAVADVQGLNSITREILGNAAHALAGMVRARAARPPVAATKPAVGLSMFGVTTEAVQRIAAALEPDHECLVFHATGVGGRAMEALMDDGRLGALIDLTTTEVADMVAGGVFPSNEDRFGAPIRSGAPYIGACGALDMVNFNAPETVPERYRSRLLHEHNPQITLMRTTPEENVATGRFIAERLNKMTGPVRFFLPEGGVSALDIEGGAFWDPVADEALFSTLETIVNQTSARRLIRVPANINDKIFTDAVLAAFHELNGGMSRAKGA